VANVFVCAGVAKNVLGRSFNVASGKGVTVREAFEMVAEKVGGVTGKNVEIKYSSWPNDADPIETRNFVADISGLYTAVVWRPEVSLEEGIDNMIRAFGSSK